MNDRIRITGIEVLARHGVLEIEKQGDQRFVIDLEVTIDLGEAGSTDELEHTVDYGDLARRAHDFVAETSFDLIESVARGLADLVLGYSGVGAVEVTVHKPEAPIDVPFGDVAVTVTRER